MSTERWYAAKCVFRHTDLSAESDGFVYEERVVVVQATSFDDAIAKAELEAQRYGADGIEYLGFIDVYHLAAAALGDCIEVYSLMRSSTLPPTAYLNAFYDTGAEHSKKVDSAN